MHHGLQPLPKRTWEIACLDGKLRTVRAENLSVKDGSLYFSNTIGSGPVVIFAKGWIACADAEAEKRGDLK